MLLSAVISVCIIADLAITWWALELARRNFHRYESAMFRLMFNDKLKLFPKADKEIDDRLAAHSATMLRNEVLMRAFTTGKVCSGSVEEDGSFTIKEHEYPKADEE
jgi:hypothetical protein